MATHTLIRPVRRDEALAVARVHVQADRETYAPIFAGQFREVALEESLARWETALTAGHSFLVATDKGAIIGFAHAGDAWMSALYLIASHRRRGVGARLLTALCEDARGSGVDEIGFTCVAANGPALAFYEAMGACQLGRTMIGDGDSMWEEIVLALSTDPAAGFRRG